MKSLRRWLSMIPRPRLGRAFYPLVSFTRGLWRVGPLRLFKQLGRLATLAFWSVISWIAGLNLRLFLQGLPALLVGMSALTVLAIAFFTQPQDVEAQYADQAMAALKAKNYTEALTCYERLAGFKNDRPDVLYKMALTADEAGHPDRCLQLMAQLASVERNGGYAQAQLWLALRAMSQPAAIVQQRQLAETYLLRALENGVEDKEAAHGLLGELYFNKGLLDDAEPHLLMAVKKKPQVRLLLALLYAMQRNKVRAQSEAKAAVNLFSTAARADLYNHFARLRWAEATSFLEEFPQAVVILEEGLAGTNDPVYRPALARVYATWFDYLGRIGDPNPGLRLALLQRGLGHDPKNIALLDRLLNVTRMKTHHEIAPVLAAATLGWAGTQPGTPALVHLQASTFMEMEGARTALRRMLAKGEGTAQVHFALGVDAWDHGRTKEARLHWERANQLAPDLPVVANNLAWLLYQTEPAELPKALDLINLAIDKAPRETNFRDTRGHIYLKMGKHKDALEDLEAALPQSPNSPELHRSLAEIYRRLDMPDMAREHERQAELKAKRAAAKRAL